MEFLVYFSTLLTLALIVSGASMLLQDATKKIDAMGLLFDPGAFWVGCHYSPYNRRFCINIIPFFTIWIVLNGGNVPVKINGEYDK